MPRATVEELEAIIDELSVHGSYLRGYALGRSRDHSGGMQEALDGFERARRRGMDLRFPRAVPDPEEAA
jgi:hypothetical protein